MSLNSIMNIATSGMNAAQTQLRVVSDNVSNVNTPGYVRKIADQQSWASQGVGAGVEIARIRLATDRFLQAASLNASADAGRQTVRYELYDRIQSMFGDPGANSGFFSQIDSVFAAFAASAENSTSGPARQDAIWKTQGLFDEAARINSQIQSVREDADARIKSAVETANSLLEQIEKLNVEIAKATVVNADSSGAQTAQAALIDQLSGLMDVRITGRAVGGVEIRTGAGILLAGQGAAKLDYVRAGAVAAETVFNEITVIEPPAGKARSLAEGLGSGEIKGLLELRDGEAPATAERLAELMSRLADELNRAHNASSAAPPPNSLTGRNVGQSLETALAGFTGRTSIVITNDQGVALHKVDLDLATMNPATFLADLNAQLGTNGSASFVDGRLKIQGAQGTGVVVVDDPAAPTNKGGRGFSHFLGLNDLISSDQPAMYETGMTGASQHGFPAGETITFRFSDAAGAKLRDVQVTVPAGGDMTSLLAALNDPMTGAGRMGTFSLNAAGEMAFTPRPGSGAQLSVLQDRTTQVPSGVSMSALFGLGGARASRADAFSVRADIVRDPALMAFAKADATGGLGAAVVGRNDARGARLLAAAGENATSFSAAGGSAGGSMSLSRYASELSGEIGSRAAMAKNSALSATALAKEATARRTSVEGVNLDEELVLMTTYQQAFNASARMVQAAKDMYDILLGMVR
ncbi:flagellar hook-associated protein FlgK [Brevundimonas diminuta]|uniref:flagellar hook-associated protein FlgK n=1 Tax=Brevundimonas diminuta TaxID=293 RepID=UPI002096E9AA|nr:flagellar hook-associated protein FlgK [Brevundimonas diminuta]MCO8017593.1 flagellar hook-associated protein FlgK [Brevundimonas diminuta]MCO8021113.1 flagellar hook-associated protein FlgK [Brevundimonas diminuta]